MRSRPDDQQAPTPPGAGNRIETAREPGEDGRDDAGSDTAATAYQGGRAEAQEGADKRSRGRRLLPELGSARAIGRRLGPVEYTLLGLIALAVAVTIVMAVVNPSG